MKTGFFCLSLAAWLWSVQLTASAEDAPTMLEKAGAAARERGAKEPALFSEEKALKKDEAQLGRLKLRAKQCVVVGAAADPEANDVQLSLKPAEGNWINDSTTAPSATLRYCGGPRDERVLLRARVRGRAAKTALVVFELMEGAEKLADKTRSSTVGQATQAAQKPDTKTLRQRLARLAEKAGAKLDSPMAPAREEDLAPNDPRTRQVSLTAGSCYRVHVTVAQSIRNWSVSLKDAAGAEVVPKASAASDMSFPKDVSFCPPTTANYQLTLHATEGSGALLWQLYGGPNQARVYAFPVGGNEEGLLPRKLRALQPKTGEGKPAVMGIQQRSLKTAEELDAIFNVEQGACYVAVAVAAPSLRSLDIELTDQRGNIVASAPDRGNLASVRACAQVPGQWRVRARAFKGYGDVAIQVFGGH